MALVDEIQKRLTAQPAPAAGGVSQQAQALAAFQAKTGKATGGGAPRASNLGEQLANAQVDAANQQLTLKGATAAAGLAAGQAQLADSAAVAQRRLEAQRADAQADVAATRVEAQANRQATVAETQSRLRTKELLTTEELNAKADAAIAKLSSDRGIAEADIFAEFRASNNELAWRRDQSQLEQLAQQLAFRDKEYVDTSKRIGLERRLESDLGFASEMNYLVLGAQLDEHLKQLGFQVDLNADKRAFDEQLAQMDLDMALAIMFQGNQDASMTAMLGNINNAGQGLAQNWPTGGGNDQFSTTSSGAAPSNANAGTSSTTSGYATPGEK